MFLKVATTFLNIAVKDSKKFYSKIPMKVYIIEAKFKRFKSDKTKYILRCISQQCEGLLHP